MTSQKVPLKNYFLLLALVFVAYSNTCGNQFVWDDTKLIAENLKIQDLRYIPLYFTHDYFDRPTAPSPSGLAQQYWRPLVLLSFAFDFFFWKYVTRGYHLTNMLLHAMNTMLVMALLLAMPKTRRIAFAASILFALHPLQTNAVSFISGRTDLLATAFILLSCIQFTRYASERGGGCGNLIGTALFFALSLMAKETALVTPILLLLLGLFMDKLSCRRIVLTMTVSTLVIGIYLGLRSTLDLPLGDLRAAARHISLPSLLASAESFIFYGRLYLFPVALHSDRFLPLPQLLDMKAWSCAALLLTAITVTGRSLLKGGEGGFFLSWFFVALLPVSNVIPIYPGVATTQIYWGEQFMYLPSIGLSAAAAYFFYLILEYAGRRRDALFACAGAILSLFGILTYSHNEYWRNEETFYARTLHFSPDNPRMLLNLGMYYFREQRYPEAQSLLLSSLQKNPGWAICHNGLGAIYAMEGRTDDARREFLKAAELDPLLAAAHFNLGMLSNDPEEAAAHYLRAIKASPLYMAPRIHLAVIREKQGKVEEAIRILDAAILLDPSSVEARMLREKFNSRKAAASDVTQPAPVPSGRMMP